MSSNDREYRQCTVTVLDNICDPDITFDNEGKCNYVDEYKRIHDAEVFGGKPGENKLEELLDNIRRSGRGKEYDCVTGISGGVDSSYLVYKAKEWGLKPLIVHFDNGWNTEIAVRNINNIIQYTGFNLYTIVVDWNEFKDLQLSYLKASVVDIEVPTDHAISGTLQTLAAKYGVKYILSGNNVATEAILPPSWIFNKNDYENLLAIHKKYGSIPLKTYPLFGPKEQFFYGLAKGITTVKPLNLLDYRKEYAIKTITKQMGWQDYGGKHYESVFTKFYQAYILPEKFHIDKRKAHLSNLVLSGQISREMALEELKKPLYNPDELQQDKEYVLKKLGLTAESFDAIMKMPRVDHKEFRVMKQLYERYPMLKLLRPISPVLKKLFR